MSNCEAFPFHGLSPEIPSNTISPVNLHSGQNDNNPLFISFFLLPCRNPFLQHESLSVHCSLFV